MHSLYPKWLLCNLARTSSLARGGHLGKVGHDSVFESFSQEDIVWIHRKLVKAFGRSGKHVCTKGHLVKQMLEVLRMVVEHIMVPWW